MFGYSFDGLFVNGVFGYGFEFFEGGVVEVEEYGVWGVVCWEVSDIGGLVGFEVLCCWVDGCEEVESCVYCCGWFVCWWFWGGGGIVVVIVGIG